MPLAALAAAALAIGAGAHAQSLTPQPSSPSTEAAACGTYDQQVRDAQGDVAKLQALVDAIPASCPAHARAISDLSGLSHPQQRIGAPAPRPGPAPAAPSPGADDPMSGMPTPHRNDGQPPPT
jgi:hypothetical protein